MFTTHFSYNTAKNVTFNFSRKCVGLPFEPVHQHLGYGNFLVPILGIHLRSWSVNFDLSFVNVHGTKHLLLHILVEFSNSGIFCVILGRFGNAILLFTWRFKIIQFKTVDHFFHGTVGWARATKASRLGSIPGRSYRRLEISTCGLSSFVLGVNGQVQRSSSRAVLPLTRRRCAIRCESSRVAYGASKRKGAPHTTRNPPKRVQKRECRSELSLFQGRVRLKIDRFQLQLLLLSFWVLLEQIGLQQKCRINFSKSEDRLQNSLFRSSNDYMCSFLLYLDCCSAAWGGKWAWVWGLSHLCTRLAHLLVASAHSCVNIVPTTASTKVLVFPFRKCMKLLY